MEERENTTYTVPANYTDSGRWLGGLVSARNAVEAIVIAVLMGYIEVALIPMTETVRIIVMIVTIVPLALLALIGIDGDSLTQYLLRMVKYLFRRRKIRFSKAVRIDEK